MAKTRKVRKPQKTSMTTMHRAPVAAPPSEPTTWSVDALTQALNATSVDEDITLLRRAGILTKDGKLAKRYTSWGNKVSRTPEINDSGEMYG